jgi:hypothetical protein
MIPIRLEISNFLSYRDTAVLDLTGIHLAGVSGPNGAGKSSLMEAMTWAGKAVFAAMTISSTARPVKRMPPRYALHLIWKGLLTALFAANVPAKAPCSSCKWMTAAAGGKR